MSKFSIFLNMSWQPDHPYNQLPLLPPAHDYESKPVLKACILARAALAALNQAGALPPIKVC